MRAPGVRSQAQKGRKGGMGRRRLTKALPIIPEILQVVMYQLQNFV